MVENMKGAHVPREAQGESWGHVQQGSANQQAQLATGPTLGSHPHKHQVPLRYLWLDVAHKPPELTSSQVGSSQLLSIQQLPSLSSKMGCCIVFNSWYLIICLFWGVWSEAIPQAASPGWLI